MPASLSTPLTAPLTAPLAAPTPLTSSAPVPQEGAVAAAAPTAQPVVRRQIAPAPVPQAVAPVVVTAPAPSPTEVVAAPAVEQVSAATTITTPPTTTASTTTTAASTTTSASAIGTAAAQVAITGATAAETLQWGAPTRVEEFDRDLSGWGLYDGPGHDGNGVRSPAAASLASGVLTITGDSGGTTAGMAWSGTGSMYGRWEGRVRAPVGDPRYNALLLLWPDAEDWPVGGEVDFMEMLDPTRQRTDFFLHYGADNRQLHGQVQVDGTQWHNWAVEWTHDRISGYVDGVEWFRNTDTTTFPPRPMHLTMQLDWFPGSGSGNGATMQVDWVRFYPVTGSGPSPAPVNSDGTAAAPSAVVPGAGSVTGGTGGTDTGTTIGPAEDGRTDDDSDDADDDSDDGRDDDGRDDNGRDAGDGRSPAPITVTVTVTAPPPPPIMVTPGVPGRDRDDDRFDRRDRRDRDEDDRDRDD